MSCEVNLQRNSEVFLSTVDLNGGAAASAMLSTNTWKVEVLAGYAFSQTAANQDITKDESGTSPDRSVERFNTAINPVEWNFSSYLRPVKAIDVLGGGTAIGAETGNAKPLADWFLWQALMSNTAAAVGTAEQSVWEGDTSLVLSKFSNANRAASGNVAIHGSNMNSLTEYNLYFKTDNVVYQTLQSSINEASVDASIDGIAMTNWTGFGTDLVELTGATRNIAIAVFGGVDNTGATIAANSTTNDAQVSSYATWASANVYGTTTDNSASFIKNRLSTIDLNSAASGSQINYTFPVTSLTWTYNNGVTYLTPEELSSLNTPIGQFTGARTVTSSLTAYLRAGSQETGEFLSDIVNNTSTQISGGSTANLQGGGTTAPYVAFDHQKVAWSFPSHNVEDVIAVQIDFLAQESNVCTGDEVTIVVGPTI